MNGIQTTIEQIAVLAERPVWGRFDHERPSFDSTHVWILLGTVVLFAGFALAIYRSSRRHKREFDTNSPANLFSELCRAHRLSYKNRRWLRRLAAARGIAEPARLFIEPKHFEAAHLPETLRSAEDEIKRLRDQLFG